jgi:hypothetical protein
VLWVSPSPVNSAVLRPQLDVAAVSDYLSD